MIGKYHFDIGAEDWLNGLTSGVNTNDGGLSPETTHLNVTKVPGVLHAPGAVTDESSGMSGEIIATCEDSTYLGKDRFILTFDNGVDDDNNIYWFDGSTLTLKATTSAQICQQGTTDMVDFNGKVYITTKAGQDGEIIEYDKTINIVEDWWTNAAHLNQTLNLSAFTAWRPLQVYERHMYVGDANKVHRISQDEYVDNGLLTLDVNEAVTALGTDQGSGKLLVATSFGTDYSATNHYRTRIHVYDGFSNKVIRVVPIEGLVTAFKNIGNTTFVFYGHKIGYWTGSGIEFLRSRNCATGTNTTLINPHRACGLDNTLYYVDTLVGTGGVNKQIMAYGETINGKRAFYPVLYPAAASGTLTSLFPVRAHELGYGFSDNKFYTFDVNSIAAVTNGGAQIYSKRYNFPRDTTIHGAIVEFDEALPNVDKSMFSLSFIDSKGTTSSTPSVNPTGRTDIHSWEFTYPTIETRSLQVRVNIGGNETDVVGIRRITVFYTPKE